jgi:hypothetical protein
MAADMIYDILKKHNPMLACIIEGHDPRECFVVYRGLDFGYSDDNHKSLPRSPHYRIGHASGRDNPFYTPPKTVSFPRRIQEKKIKPFRGPVFITNYPKSGFKAEPHQKRIDYHSHASMFR